MTELEGEYTVRIMSLPPSVNATTVPDEEGHFNIYINAHLSAEAQRLAFWHEIRHVLRGDADSDQDITAIERAL